MDGGELDIDARKADLEPLPFLAVFAREESRRFAQS
jgi:hypothetical protein